MRFELLFSEKSFTQFQEIRKAKSKQRIFKAVQKILGLVEINLKHPSLNTHVYDSLKGPNGEKVFESYIQNRTPGAYRIFWCYGPGKSKITIIAIIPHP